MGQYVVTEEQLTKISQEYPTPFYVYRQEIMEQNYRRISGAIYPGARLFYSMKANPLLGVCQIFARLNAGIETASKGELNLALKAGFAPENIIFTSPGKTREEIVFAVKKGVKLINVESLEEAKLVNEVAKEENVVMKIGIRVNPAASYSNAKIKMSGVSSQFGIEEADLTGEFWDEIKACDNIEVQGIQVYMGTQMLLAEDIIKNAEYAMKLALRLSDEFGFALRYLNVGGGFGVKYFKNENELDYEALKTGMEQLKEDFGDAFDQTEVIFESGRGLMAETGEYVTKVLYVKESKGQKYVVCDGGSNFHSSAAFLGRFIRNNFPLHTFPEGEEMGECTICGPLCTPLDVIGQKVSVNAGIKSGDLVVIEQSGAYGYTYSPCMFLSHEQPFELLVTADGVKVLRERRDAEMYLEGQRLL